MSIQNDNTTADTENDRRKLIKIACLALGGAINPLLSKAVLAGVGSAPVDALTPPLSAQQLVLVRAIAELIIPETDTPGAIAADVPHFIQNIYSRWYTDEERKVFLTGLQALNATAVKKYKQPFGNTNRDQQTELLAAAEALFNSAEPKPVLGQFFHDIKELVVLGYYTSEVGAKQELVYQAVPVRYKGDYLYTETGRRWSH